MQFERTTIQQNSAAISADILEEHRNPRRLPPELRAMERLTAIDQEIAQAASRGNTRKIRELRSERDQIAHWLNQQSASMLEKVEANAQHIEPPAKGEEAQLAEQLKRVNNEIVRKQGERENLLAKLARMPENEGLLKQVDRMDSELRTLDIRRRGIDARTNEIARWHEGEARRKRAAEEERRRRDDERERKQIEKSVAELAGEIPDLWKTLLGKLSEIDRAETRLKQLTGLKNICEPVDTARERIRKRTNGLISYVERTHNGASRWNITNNHPDPQVAIPGAGSGGIGVGIA